MLEWRDPAKREKLASASDFDRRVGRWCKAAGKTDRRDRKAEAYLVRYLLFKNKDKDNGGSAHRTNIAAFHYPEFFFPASA